MKKSQEKEETKKQTKKGGGVGGSVKIKVSKNKDKDVEKNSNNKGKSPPKKRMDDGSKLYTEQDRLRAAFTLNSTLENYRQNDQSSNNFQWEESDGDDSNSFEYKIRMILTKNVGMQNRGDQDHEGRNHISKIINQMRTTLISRLYQYNFLISEFQGIKTYFYYSALFLEFLQLLYFATYQVSVVNEFVFDPTRLSQSSQSSSNSTQNGLSGTTKQLQQEKFDASLLNQDPAQQLLAENEFYFDEYLAWTVLNLQFDSQSQFVAFYITLIALFMLIIVVIGFGSKMLFMSAMRDELKDGSTKVLVKFMSVLTASFMGVLQIPFQSIMLANFFCGKNTQNSQNTLNLCEGSSSIALTVITAFLLPLYLTFIYLQTQLYPVSAIANNNIEDILVEDSAAQFLRTLWKLFLSLTFLFLDQSITQYYRLLAFLIGAVICARNLSNTVQCDRIQTWYDLIATLLFINVSILQMTDNDLNFCKLVLIIVSNGMLGYLILRFGKNFHAKKLSKNGMKVIKDAEVAVVARRVRQIQRLINSTMPQKRVLLEGMMYYHLEECDSDACQCTEIFNNFQKEIFEHEIYFHSNQNSDQNNNYVAQNNENKSLNFADEMSGIRNILNQQIPNDEGKDKANRDYFDMQSNTQIISHNVFKNQEDRPATKQRAIDDLSVPRDQRNELIVQQDDFFGDVQNIQKLPQQHHQEGQNNNESLVKIGTQNLMIEKIEEQDALPGDPDQQQPIEFYQLETQEYDELNSLLKFKILSLYIEQLIKKFPKAFELRIFQATVQCNQLKNQFKAAFELMKCEKSLNLNFKSRFVVFQTQRKIQKFLVTENPQFFSEGSSQVAQQIYLYERLYQRYIKYSYFAANAALNFWRELLKKNIDTQVLLQKGSDIYKVHTDIKKLAEDIMDISSSDIKFLLSYATFLRQIIHMDQEAQYFFDKAFHTYQRLPHCIISQGSGNSIGGQNGIQAGSSNDQINLLKSMNDLHYQENTGLGIVVMTLSSDRFGTIIHTNNELQRVLGYKRSDLIGRNVSYLVPPSLAPNHDYFLTQFLQTGHAPLISQPTPLLSLSKSGYLTPIKLLIQLYPHMQGGRITVLGFIQGIPDIESQNDGNGISQGITLQREESINLNNKENSEDYQQTHKAHYIMVDDNQRINCVSEGLQEIGLISDFFNNQNSYTKQISMQSLIIDKLQDFDQLVQDGGITVRIDTSTVLDCVNIESLHSTPHLRSIVQNQGHYRVHLLLKRIEYKGCGRPIDIYRLVILPNKGLTSGESDLRQNQSSTNVGANNNLLDPTQQNDDTAKRHLSKANDDLNGVNSASSSEPQLNSMSDSASQSSNSSKQFSNLMQDFKTQSLSKTPMSVRKLNVFLILMIIVSFILSTVDYYEKQNYLVYDEDITEMLVKGQGRSVKYTQLLQNLRSLINIANGLEFDRYTDSSSLGKVDRFDYLKEQIQQQTQELYDLMAYFSMKKTDYYNQNLKQTESKQIETYRLTMDGLILPDKQRYKIAFDGLLNKIAKLNVTERGQLEIPLYVLEAVPFGVTQQQTKINVTQQDLAYILLNGVRVLLEKTHEIEQELIDLVQGESSSHGLKTFILIMSLGLTMTVLTMLFINHMLARADYLKSEILGVFIHLDIGEIEDLYRGCDNYINSVDTESWFQIPSSKIDQNGQKQNLESGIRGSVNKNENSNLLNLFDMHEQDSHQSSGSTFSGQMIIKSEKSKVGNNNEVIRLSRKSYYGLIVQKIHKILKREEQQSAQSVLQVQFNQEQAQLHMGTPKNGNKQIEVQNMDSSSSSSNSSDNNGKESSTNKKNNKQKRLTKKFTKEELPDSFKQTRTQQSKGTDQLPFNGIQTQKDVLNDHQLRQISLLSVSTQRKRTYYNKVFSNFFSLLPYLAFFIYTYLVHIQQLQTLQSINSEAPVFYKRFEYLSLEYQYMREKIINGGDKYDDMVMDFKVGGSKIDQERNDPIENYYNTESMMAESEIQRLKTLSPSYLDPLLSFVNKLDSKDFCDTVFTQSDLLNNTVSSRFTKLTTQRLEQVLSTFYVTEIKKDVPVMMAIITDDIPLLQKYLNEGYDLGNLDYDRRTPLHAAARRGNMDEVKLLIGAGVHINLYDRWGITPLSDAKPHPAITQYLLERGAVMGSPRKEFTSKKINLNDNEYRLFFAAYYNDIIMMDALETVGWNVNVGDRSKRTPLHIAAGQGSYDAAVRLINSGADVNVVDARGATPLDEAISAKQYKVVNMLIEKVLIINQCKKFEEQILSKGFSNALGTFNRKFTDLHTILDTIQDKSQLLRLLGANMTLYQQKLRDSNKSNTSQDNSSLQNQTTTKVNGTLNSNSSTTQRMMQVFLSTQELYIRKVLNKLEVVMHATYKNITQSYKLTIIIVYYIFLGVQLFVFFIFRKKLIYSIREDLINSRGILNLIPDRVFKDHQQDVEKIIKML